MKRLFTALAALAIWIPFNAMAEIKIKRWNPEGLDQSVGYSQVVTIEGSGKMILLGGKAGLKPDGFIPETLAEQSKLTWENIDLALKAAGATREDVVEIQIFIVDLANIDPQPAYQDVRNFFPTGHKPVSMVIGVSALAIPELKLEINVRAIVAN
ncbi:MAG: RidA family protein [Rhodospirillaceae bacterium]|jgi:2-iminobutanoate/2-iminopropanoate deaminase|nr:RidA family protein [Rhodospirillaceae bacterium]